MTLRELPLGRPARILGFRALGEADGSRLRAMGLEEDQAITKLLRTPLRDPVECLAGTQLLAIESWLLDHILVAP